MKATDFIVPVIFAFVLIYGVIKKVDVFSEFTDGVKEGLVTVKDIFPALFTLVLSIGVFRASGGLGLLSEALQPVTGLIQFPKEVTPLFILRPFSGSGAIALYESILTGVGPDSFAGRVASVMLGSSETTFYTIAVYFAATKIKKTRHALPAAISGDVLTAVFSTVVVLLFFYR